jgi:hypothetical protein
MFRPLFVTSFRQDMFLSTGARLIVSFFVRNIPGALLVCHEQDLGCEIVSLPPRLLTFDLDTSFVLSEWLRRNRDIIPKSLGGDAELCKCPEPDNVFGPHRSGCCWSWFNKNASRWFRKIVSLEYAQTLSGYDAVIWMDSDCRFVSSVDVKDIEDWFGRYSVFFLKGRRNVIESGVIGFRRDHGGDVILRDVIERYRSGTFRRDERWDDGYQFQLVVRRNPGVLTVDLGGDVTGAGDVVPTSRLGRYIDHAKGVHRVTGVMT